MKNFFRDNRTFLIVAGVVSAFTAVVWLLYAVWGHQLVESIYNGESIGFLNRVITEQSTRPVEFFLQRADEIFYKEVLFFPLLNLIFYFALFKSLKCLLRMSESSVVRFPDPRRQPYHADLLIAGTLYCVFTLVLFYPYLDNITNHLIGPPEDNQKYLWNMWWGQRAVFDAATHLDFTNYIFYPEGSSLLYNDYSWYNLLLSFLLRPFFSPTAAYNLLLLHTFVVAGIGAFMLVKYLTGNSFAAFMGGFLFAFNPSHFAHAMHHLNISSIQFTPFFVLFAIRTFKDGTRKDLAWASIFLLLNALCDWHYLIFSICFIVFCYLYLALKKKRFLLHDILFKASVMIGGTVVVLSPWLFRMIILALQRPAVTGGHSGFVVDAVGPFLPHTYHILSNVPIIGDLNRGVSGNTWESCAYLGLVNIVILALAFRPQLKKMATYLGGMLVFLVLSMGTYIHVLGAKLPIMLPYSIIKHIPILSNVRVPARNIVFVYLFLAIVIGLALKLLLDRARIKKRYYILLSMLVGLLILDYHSTSNEMTEVYLPRCYSAIDNETGDFGILDLPGGWAESEKYMMYQTLHGLPIVQGVIPRKIGISLQDSLELEDLSRQKAQLTGNNVKYIVLHKRLISAENPLDTTPYKESYTTIYEDKDNIVCRVY